MDQDRWLELCERLGCPSAGARFRDLQQAHSETHRRYHTARHVEECLEVFDSLRTVCQFPEEVEVAIWLHDVVYKPRRSDNEERSADLAVGWLDECGVDPAVVARIRSLILVTRHSGEPQTVDERVLVDIDLHILGSSADRFDEYEQDVRAEYGWVPSIVFRKRRAEILRAFLDRDALYQTEECRARFEARARSNLQRSLQRLAS